MDQDLSQEIAALLGEGRKIEAIALLRQHTGMGLAEAKAAVERLTGEAGPASPAETPPPPRALDADVQALVDQGKLIAAIKLLRERRGLGLKEAKDEIDRATGKVHKVGCGAALVIFAAASLWFCC